MIDPDAPAAGPVDPSPHDQVAAADAPAASTEPRDIAEGRGPAPMSLTSALALEAAQLAVGCPTPPSAQAVIDAADPAEISSAREGMAAAAAAAASTDNSGPGRKARAPARPKE